MNGRPSLRTTPVRQRRRHEVALDVEAPTAQSVTQRPPCPFERRVVARQGLRLVAADEVGVLPDRQPKHRLERRPNQNRRARASSPEARTCTRAPAPPRSAPCPMAPGRATPSRGPSGCRPSSHAVDHPHQPTTMASSRGADAGIATQLIRRATARVLAASSRNRIGSATKSSAPSSSAATGSASEPGAAIATIDFDDPLHLRHRPVAQPAPGLRLRGPLLPGRQAGEGGDQGPAHRAAPRRRLW